MHQYSIKFSVKLSISHNHTRGLDSYMAICSANVCTCTVMTEQLVVSVKIEIEYCQLQQIITVVKTSSVTDSLCSKDEAVYVIFYRKSKFLRFLGINLMHVQTVCTRLTFPPTKIAWIRGYGGQLYNTLLNGVLCQRVTQVVQFLLHGS